MGKLDEVNEKAMLVMSLRRQNWTIPKIALYLNCHKRYVPTLLARARKLCSLFADASDSKTLIGETLAGLEELLRIALENLAKVDPGSNAAVGLLNAARATLVEIKRLYQEAGLMVKIPEEIKITNIPMEIPVVRQAIYGVLKLINETSRKNDEA